MKVKVEILKDTVANKKPVKAGEIVELSQSDARYLINILKARIAMMSEASEPVEEIKSEAKLEKPKKFKKKNSEADKE